MIFKLALVVLLLGQTGQTPSTSPEKATQTATMEAGKQETATPEAGTKETSQQGGAQGQSGEQPKRMSPWLTWGLLIGVLVVFYLLMILPQRRRQKKHQEMLKALQRGDKIVTSGGIVGSISRVKEDTFIVKTAEKTELEISKSVVSEKK